MKRKYYEVKELLQMLVDKGFTIESVNDGGDEDIDISTVDEAYDAVLSVCESSVYMKNPEGKSRWLLFVLGNEPGTALCDHTVDEIIDEVSDEIYEKYSNMEDSYVELKEQSIPVSVITDYIQKLENKRFANSSSVIVDLFDLLEKQGLPINVDYLKAILEGESVEGLKVLKD